MKNWNDLNKTGDNKYLLKKNKKDDGRGEEAYSELQKSFIAAFGLSDRYKDILKKRLEIVIYGLDKHITGDKTKETFANIAKNELEDMLNQKVPSPEKLKIYIEKQLGFRLNLSKISVYDYFTYARELNG